MADQGSAAPAGSEGDKAEKNNGNLNSPVPKKEKTAAQIERDRIRRRRRRQRKKMIQGLSGEVKSVFPGNGSRQPNELPLQQEEKPSLDQKFPKDQTMDQSKKSRETYPKPIQGKSKAFEPEKNRVPDLKEIPEGQKVSFTEKPVEFMEPEMEPPKLDDLALGSEVHLQEKLEAPLEAYFEQKPEPQHETESEKKMEPASSPEPEPKFESQAETQGESQLQPEQDLTIAQVNQEPVNPVYEDFTTVSHSFQPPSPLQEPESFSLKQPEEQSKELIFEPKHREQMPSQPVENFSDTFEEHPDEKEEQKNVLPEDNEEQKFSEKLEKEELGEKKSLIQIVGLQLVGFVKKFLSWIGTLLKKIPILFGKASAILKPKFIIALLMLGVFGFFVYWAYSSKFYEGAMGYVKDFFTPKIPPKIEVTVNENDLKSFGITSALLFGSNNGSLQDRIPVQIEMATFFGELKEPAVKGETGVSAATFYGELKDQAEDINEFVEYMRNLEKVQSLYSIDVYAMLDRTTNRDAALFEYLDNLTKAREESLKIHQQVGINIDDLKVSLESLNPDKTQYESDFFVAMEQLQAEKSDLLLKGFVDISQKQTALRARINALNKLATYYATALNRLEKRIEAVDKNREALIQGIRVVDIPGGGLDIIIK